MLDSGSVQIPRLRVELRRVVAPIPMVSQSVTFVTDGVVSDGLVREEGRAPPTAHEALRPQPADGLRQLPRPSEEPMPVSVVEAATVPSPAALGYSQTDGLPLQATTLLPPDHPSGENSIRGTSGANPLRGRNRGNLQGLSDRSAKGTHR
ncbi:hypothetical protein Dimus_030429 [Dionaea muscipula]